VVDVNRAVAERLYRQLTDCRVRYDQAVWQPGAGQRLRHPGWALSPRESATCIEFALIYAAMCLRERVVPYLVMLCGESAAHVMVAIDLRRALKEGPPSPSPKPEGTEAEPSSGVYRVIDRDTLASDPGLLLLDCTHASVTYPLSFKDGVAAADATLRLSESCRENEPAYYDVHLVDVALRHALGDEPLDAPTGRAALRHPLPTPQRAIRAFPSRELIVARLNGRSGTVVALGPQGVGKSELARHAAATVDNGVGWFLAAASKVALINALAAAELYERGWHLEDLEVADRDAFARAALTRLAGADAPWAVVVDNADRGPDELRGWLPEPDPAAGQLVIITTTNSNWHGSGFEVLNVDPLLSEEVTELLEHPRLVELALGRPLLIHAFVALRRFLRLSPKELAEGLDTSGDPDEPTTGPRAFWGLLRDALTVPHTVEVASMLAWLPPDRTPLDVLEAITPGSGQAVEALLAAGLIGRIGDSEAAVSLHRLLGRVIREDVQGRGSDTATVTKLLGVPEARDLLMSEADADTTAALASSLYHGTPPSDSGCDERALGVALCALGAMQEMHETTKTSSLTFGQALDYLDEADPQNHSLIADCLHGQAREVNQHHVKDPRQVADARQKIEHAIALCDPGDAGGIGKHEALEGLLRQRHAVNGMPCGSVEQIAELHEALKILEQSWTRRREALGDGHPLVDRGLFNRGGIRIDLAQREPTKAVEYLTVAEQVYGATLEYRTRTYRDPHPLTAASHYGLAVTWYYRALLDPSADAQTLLFNATKEASIALDQRWYTDGSLDGEDAVKSAHLLSKITLARCHRVKGNAELASFMDEVTRELKQ
jgi:hypothetical protein